MTLPQPFERLLMPSNAPVFVLGCSRSGTTLLRLILDAHPNIACPPESKFIVQLAKILELEQARNGFMSLGYSEEEVRARIRSWIDGVFAEYCGKTRKLRWADKTPHHLDHMETLDQIFNGEAQYLGIVRHGLDVANSLMGYDFGVLKEYRQVHPPGVAEAQFWVDQNEKLLRCCEIAGDRFHFVRYEELTTSPETELKGMFAFLGEPWDPSVLQYNDVPHDAGYGDVSSLKRKQIEANSEKYLHWPKEQQQAALDVARTMLIDLGYEI